MKKNRTPAVQIVKLEQIKDVVTMRFDDNPRKGARIQEWRVHYSVETMRKSFDFMCSFDNNGKLHIFHGKKDSDRVVAALKKNPSFFKRLCINACADYLAELVRELGVDAMRQAFDEAIVKSVTNA